MKTSLTDRSDVWISWFLFSLQTWFLWTAEHHQSLWPWVGLRRLSLGWNWSRYFLYAWTQLSPSLFLILFSVASLLKLPTGVCSLEASSHIAFTAFSLASTTLTNVTWSCSSCDSPRVLTFIISALTCSVQYYPVVKLPEGNSSGVGPLFFCL